MTVDSADAESVLLVFPAMFINGASVRLNARPS